VYGDSGESIREDSSYHAGRRVEADARNDAPACGGKVDRRVCGSATCTSRGDVRAPLIRRYTLFVRFMDVRGVAWRGVAWRGVAWRGAARRGLAWRGAARSGAAVELWRLVYTAAPSLRSRRFYGAWRELMRVGVDGFPTTFDTRIIPVAIPIALRVMPPF